MLDGKSLQQNRKAWDGEQTSNQKQIGKRTEKAPDAPIRRKDPSNIGVGQTEGRSVTGSERRVLRWRNGLSSF